MSAPAEKRPPLTAVPKPGPQSRFLKKGELLFAEGESSRAMYLIKNGMIRIFKKKGDSAIEIDTIHSGNILGELAFLDGNPRSASGEALTDCELVEISGVTFQQTLGQLPDWLKILMKTIVGRLRAASTRIRQLETASSAYDYGDDGKRTSHYVYLSPSDSMKICTALLLVGSRNGIQAGADIDIRVGLLQRYANQIMGVPVAKVTSMLDILAQSEVTAFGEGEHAGKVFLKDTDFLEQLIAYMNEENLKEPSKRHDLSPKGFLIMSMIYKHLDKYPVDANGLCSVNLAEIKNLEVPQSGPMAGKEPFRMTELDELTRFGYSSTLNMKSSSEAFTIINHQSFVQAFRLQRVVIGIAAMNEQHRR